MPTETEKERAEKTLIDIWQLPFLAQCLNKKGSAISHAALQMKSPTVDLVHAANNAFTDKQLNRLCNERAPLLKQAQIVVAHTRKHKTIHRLSLPLGVHLGPPHADFQPREFERAKMLGHRAHAIMTASPAFAHYLDSAGPKIDVVVHHQKALHRDLKIIEKTPDAFAGAIHVRLRLEIHHLAAKGAPLVKQPLHFQGFNPRLRRKGEMVKKIKTYIVPGKVVIRSGIAKADKQKSRIRHEQKKERKQIEPKTCFGSISA